MHPEPEDFLGLHAARDRWRAEKRQSLEQLMLEVEFLNVLHTKPCGSISAPEPPDTLRYRLGQWLIKLGQWVRG